MPRAPHRPLRPGAESHDSGAVGLADMLEPDPPVPVQDFAFADTVYASELDEDGPPPASGPIYVQDATGHTQCLTPLAFPLPVPIAAEAVDLPTRLRALFAHARDAVRASAEEMRGLWADTDDLVEPTGDGTVRRLRRALALWSFFHWSRADVTRAATIGLAVFITAGAIGTTAMDLGGSASAASSDEVRVLHTLDQHTGKSRVPRSKR